MPYGINSTSSSPDKYYLSNSLFSPTYEETILLIYLFLSNIPRPQSSTPQLLEQIVKFFGPWFLIASIRFDGIPQSPKPPTNNVYPY